MENKKIEQEYKKQIVSNTKVWRYMDFYKFISLLQFKAIWFSKLQVLEDQYEGTFPFIDYQSFKERDNNIQEWIKRENKTNAVLSTVDDNINHGRELAVVNCWNLNEDEDIKMWENYTSGNTGVLIRSTLGRLRRAIPCDPQITRIDKVKYVDMENYKLGNVAAAQVFERALLKSSEYSYENELRILTLNLAIDYCLNEDGSEITELQKQGPGQYKEDRKGIYIKVDTNLLIKNVVISPKASYYFYNLIKGLLKTFNINASVKKSIYTESN